MSNENDVLTIEPPDTESAIRESLGAERRRLQTWTEQQVKVIEKLRDRNLTQLDRTVDLLSEGFSAQPKSPGSSKSRSRRKHASRCTPAQFETRLKALYRFLLEKGKPMPSSDIRRALNLTQSQALRALSRLIDDGNVRRIGIGSAMKYEAKPGKPNRMELTNRTAGAELSLGTRMLQVIQGKGEATPDELAREFRVPFEHVQRSCSKLVSEDEIAVDTRGGRRVYTALEVA